MASLTSASRLVADAVPAPRPSVPVDDGTPRGQRFAAYGHVTDPAGRTLLAFSGTLNPSAIPSTVVLDEQGRVAASIIGEVPSRRTLVDLVEDVRA